jgi:hypothetical protein
MRCAWARFQRPRDAADAVGKGGGTLGGTPVEGNFNSLHAPESVRGGPFLDKARGNRIPTKGDQLAAYGEL